MIEKILKQIKEVNLLEPKGISDRFLKFDEEYGEFAAEVIKLRGLSPKPYDREHLIEEGADALQVLFSILYSICAETDIEFDEFILAMEEKTKVWHSKICNYTKNG